MTGVLGFSELALGQVEAESTSHRYLKEVWHSARQGASWVHQLQMFGRRPAAAPPSSSVIATVAEQKEATRRQHVPGVRLEANLPPDLPAVAIDAEGLKQILAQLISNGQEAVVPDKAAEAGRAAEGRAAEGRAAEAGRAVEGKTNVVALSARAVTLGEAEALCWLGRPRPGPAVEITVADAGPGVRPEIQARLFRELFVSSKPRHRGLGLAVVYGIVRAYQGGMRLDERKPHGTQARVVLPAAVRVADGAAATPVLADKRAARILVVDDDPAIVHMIAATLGEAGYRACAAPPTRTPPWRPMPGSLALAW